MILLLLSLFSLAPAHAANPEKVSGEILEINRSIEVVHDGNVAIHVLDERYDRFVIWQGANVIQLRSSQKQGTSCGCNPPSPGRLLKPLTFKAKVGEQTVLVTIPAHSTRFFVDADKLVTQIDVKRSKLGGIAIDYDPELPENRDRIARDWDELRASIAQLCASFVAAVSDGRFADARAIYGVIVRLERTPFEQGAMIGFLAGMPANERPIPTYKTSPYDIEAMDKAYGVTLDQMTETEFFAFLAGTLRDPTALRDTNMVYLFDIARDIELPRAKQEEFLKLAIETELNYISQLARDGVTDVEFGHSYLLRRALEFLKADRVTDANAVFLDRLKAKVKAEPSLAALLKRARIEL
jgi:hypothetical protein